MTITDPSFGVAMNPRHEGSEEFSFDPKVPEHTGISPLNVSSFTGYEQGRAEFIRGASYLGFGTPEAPQRKTILPQQYVIADAIQAQESGVPLHSVVSVVAPRRSTKTAAFWAVAIGRISDPERPQYQVAFTAQTQVKARARFLKDVVAPLERMYGDPATAPFIINRGAATSSLTWKETGGVITIIGPSEEAFRGDAYSLIGIDEAQEIEPGEDSDSLIQGILPTLATTTVMVDGELEAAGQLVLLGTAGDFKAGLFHDYLEKGRAGTSGVVEYAADPKTPDFDPDESDTVTGTTADPEVWKLAHPAIGVLIPLATITASFLAMTLQAFKQEWLGIWPDSSSNSFLSMEKLAACAIEARPLPSPVTGFALAFAAHHEARTASIVAVWRDADEVAHVLLLDHREGTKWAGPALKELYRKYRVPVVYDAKSTATVNVIEALTRGSSRVPTEKRHTWDVANAASLFKRELDTGALVHYAQDTFTQAAGLAVKGTWEGSERWSFRRPKSAPGSDISPLEAASLALHYYDENSGKSTIMPPKGM